MARATALWTAIAIVVCGAACARKRTRVPPAPRIGQSESGIASWYGEPYHGRRAANGEIYDMEKLTAAHRTLPFGTWVRVHNLDNGKRVDVRITDRGPFIDRRIIDLSRAAARQIDMLIAGLAKVRVEVIPAPAPVAPAGAGAERVPETFAVQVGAFRDRENAERVVREMEREYGSARIETHGGDAPLWRVLVGSFERIEDAESVAAQIRRRGGESFVVRAVAASSPM